jgi:hypothetical protein
VSKLSAETTALTGHLRLFRTRRLFFTTKARPEKRTGTFTPSTSIHTHVARDLTPFEGARALRRGLSRKIRGEILVSINRRDPKYFHLFRIDLKTNAISLVAKSPGFGMIVADDSFRPRLAPRTRADGGEASMRIGTNGSWEDSLPFSHEVGSSSSFPQLDPPGEIVFLRDRAGMRVVAIGGVRSFLVQHRNASGVSRRLTIGRFGVLTVEARDLAKQMLAGCPKSAGQERRCCSPFRGAQRSLKLGNGVRARDRRSPVNCQRGRVCAAAFQDQKAGLV